MVFRWLTGSSAAEHRHAGRSRFVSTARGASSRASRSRGRRVWWAIQLGCQALGRISSAGCGAAASP